MNQLDLLPETLGADDVRIALIKLAEATFLRVVRTPDRLHLVALKGHRQLSGVLDHVAREGHRQIIAQRLVRNFRGLGLHWIGRMAQEITRT